MSPLAAAALVVFLEGLSFGIILPVLTPFAGSLGGGVGWAGVLFAAATLPRVVFAPIWGRCSDRFGRRPAMVIVACGTTAASILWAMSEGLDGIGLSALLWLLTSRIVYGIFAAQSVLGMAVASDVSDPSRRASAMGMLGAAFGVAFAIGPAIGGLLSHGLPLVHFGWVAGGLQATSVLVAALLLRETRPAAAAMERSSALFVRPKTMLHLAAIPMVTSLIVVTIISTAAYSTLFPTFQPLTEAWYHWTPRQVGLAFSAFGLIGAVVQGGMIRPAVRHLGEKNVAIAGLTALALGLLGIASHPPMGGFWATLALMAIGTGLCVPTITGLMSLAVHERDQGAVHGLNQSATSIGRTLGFAGSGAVFATLGPGSVYALAAVAAAAGIIVLALVRGDTVHADRAVEATADEML